MAYQELKSYQQAKIICDFTVEFLKKYIARNSRTYDQMTQAARSGKQNIVEGTAVSKTAPKSELMLLGVARGSFEELLEDYKDFLRQRGRKMWEKNDPRALEIRKLVYKTDRSDRTDRTDKIDKMDRLAGTNGTDRTDKTNKTNKTDRTYTTYRSYASYLNDPEKAANAMIVLINQTNYLLDEQLRAVRAQMAEKGVSEFTHSQKLSRVLYERKQRNKEFDEYLKSFLGQEKNRTDKTDRADKTERTDRVDKIDRTDKTDRTDRTEDG